jgi:peroxiredoxin
MSVLKPGDQFPSFTLVDIDGASRSVNAAGEEPTLLAFFKNSCPTCMMTFPFLQRLYQRVEGAALRYWGISQDSIEETRAFGRAYGIDFPLAPDGDGFPVSNSCGLSSVPTLFLLEANASIARVCVGFSKADLEWLAAEFRRRFRIPGLSPLFTPSDEVPELRPG